MTIAARYDDILDATVTVLARRGFHQARIREIADTAQLSLAGLYHYVRGKDELVFLALARALDDLVVALDRALGEARTSEDKLLALIRTGARAGSCSSATILLLGMLNGVATRPFLRARPCSADSASQDRHAATPVLASPAA